MWLPHGDRGGAAKSPSRYRSLDRHLMSSKSAVGSTRRFSHRPLQCAAALFLPNGPSTSPWSVGTARQPPPTELRNTSAAQNEPCACPSGPRSAELNGHQSP